MITTAAAPSRWLAFGLVVLAIGLSINAVLGPLLADTIEYPFSESIRNQAIGLEAVTLGLAVPWALFAAWLNLRGHALGPILAIPPAAYAAYMMVQYIVGPNYLEYRPAVILHLGIFVLGLTVTVAGWALHGPHALASAPSSRYALIPLGLALFVFSRYLPMFFGAAGNEPLTDEFANDPAMYWSIVLLDLGIVVPAAIATAIAVYRGNPNAAKALYALLGWFVLVPISVAAMAIVMLVNDDPNKSLPTAVLLSVAAVVFTVFAGWVHWRLTSQP